MEFLLTESDQITNTKIKKKRKKRKGKKRSIMKVQMKMITKKGKRTKVVIGKVMYLHSKM